MSYMVTLTNQSRATLTTSDGKQVPPNQQWTSGVIGDAWVSSDQFGHLNFLDIADTHIPGDSSETWGVLISYQGEEIVGRYEGGGQLSVAINAFGQAELGGMDLRQVSLPGLLIAGQTSSA